MSDKVSVAIQQIELQTHDPLKIMRLYELRKSGDGFTCRVAIRSGDFACDRPFFVDGYSLWNAVEALPRMNTELSGKLRLNSQHDPDYIDIECFSNGHVVVSGQFEFHSDLPQVLRFAFETDQTVLAPLLKSFQLLKNE